VSGSARALVAAGALLCSLTLVAWRQSRALGALGELERVRNERALVQAEKEAMERAIQHLESRARVVPVARDRLGMRTPQATEIVILPGEAP
jgi:cell division protein FtsL